MSKHDVLTDEEFARFTPPKRTLHSIEEYRRRHGLEPSQMNILEWGCGRGKETLWFRQRGYNAFGVDVDPEPIRNGGLLLERKGFDASALRVLSEAGASGFPPGYFHFTYSNQVFEHVRDLDRVAAELRRITASGGEGHHVFPAHKYVVEGHLFMPFVHWLPKNRWRERLISLYVRVGREPHWAELEGRTAREKSATYYAYSIAKTFYRSPREIRQSFQRAGFNTSFETIKHPRIANHGVLGPMTRIRPLRGMVDWLLLNFVSNELHLEVP